MGAGERGDAADDDASPGGRVRPARGARGAGGERRAGQRALPAQRRVRPALAPTPHPSYEKYVLPYAYRRRVLTDTTTTWTLTFVTIKNL